MFKKKRKRYYQCNDLLSFFFGNFRVVAKLPFLKKKKEKAQ